MYRTLVAVVVVLSALLLSVTEEAGSKLDSGSDSEGNDGGSQGGDRVTRRDASRYLTLSPVACHQTPMASNQPRCELYGYAWSLLFHKS